VTPEGSSEAAGDILPPGCYDVYVDGIYLGNTCGSQEGSLLDGVQTGLDVFGLIPLAGEVADGVNALISALRGDWPGAGLSVAAMWPAGGQAATAGKLGRRVFRGFTKHGVDQAITRAFMIRDVMRIIREGKAVPQVGRYSMNTVYTLGENTVVIAETGRNANKVISVFSTASGTRRGLGRGEFQPF
jgi:hypothetical protein